MFIDDYGKNVLRRLHGMPRTADSPRRFGLNGAFAIVINIKHFVKLAGVTGCKLNQVYGYFHLRK